MIVSLCMILREIATKVYISQEYTKTIFIHINIYVIVYHVF